MEAEERGAAEAPMDLDLDPAVLLAARELRAGLIRVHPSFRFEEGLAARLARTAGGDRGAPDDETGACCHIVDLAVQGARRRRRGRRRAAPAGLAAMRDSFASPAAPRRLSLAARPSRPLVVGGVGVASAAISIGAVYVAWRWSRASQSPMVRAVRAGRSGRAYASGHGRRAGVLHGILGVMS